MDLSKPLTFNFGLKKKEAYDIHDVAQAVGLPKPMVYNCLNLYAKRGLSNMRFTEEQLDIIRAYYRKRVEAAQATSTMANMIKTKTSI